jgi:hypothetical protein
MGDKRLLHLILPKKILREGKPIGKYEANRGALSPRLVRSARRS